MSLVYKWKVGWIAPGDCWLPPVTESQKETFAPQARVPAVWAADRREPGRRASNHSAAVLLDNSVSKVKSTVPDILQMPHNGSN